MTPKELLDELNAYTLKLRLDWSDFDGRSLRRFVKNWSEEMEQAIIATVAEERRKILAIIAGGDRPWQELYKAIEGQ